MTAAVDALAHLDDDLALSPDDRAALAVFDRHVRWDAGCCVVCGKPGGPECASCHIAAEIAVARSADV